MSQHPQSDCPGGQDYEWDCELLCEGDTTYLELFNEEGFVEHEQADSGSVETFARPEVDTLSSLTQEVTTNDGLIKKIGNAISEHLIGEKAFWYQWISNRQ
jgi:hypothetical protein